MAKSELQDDAAEGPKMGPSTREEDAEFWQKTAEELLKDVPPPPIQPLPEEHAHDVSKYKFKPDLSPAESSQKCADAIEKYDAEECKAHREEIDTLLVFAGLFSAVVTAFSIESYQWLQTDPNDTIIALLSNIAHPGSNQTQMTSVETGVPNAVSVRINAYWFLSLVLSLSAALVAILCKQWVREFERHSGLSDAEQFIAVRQMKLEGFESWRVSGIVATIPLLLQCALGLFTLGLVDLLWHLHRTVAIVVLVPTVALLIFYALTTLLPGLQAILSPFWFFISLPQCPFKSPQAMLALRMLVLLPVKAPVIDSLCSFYWHCAVFLYTSFRGQGSPDSSLRRTSMTWLNPTLRALPSNYRRDFLTFRHTRSWPTVDHAFTSGRDAFYVSYAIFAAEFTVEVPRVPGHYFRGLVWLRDHVNQPGMRSCIFWSIWHTIPIIARDAVHPRLMWPAFLSGLKAISPHNPFLLRHAMLSHPAGPALVYACSDEIDPGFISEALIHYFPELQCEAIDTILNHLRTFFKTDADTLLSILYAIMSRALAKSERRGELREVDSLLNATRQAVIAHPGSLRRRTLACVAAFYLRHLRVQGDLVDDRSVMTNLPPIFREVLTASREKSAQQPSIAEKAAFAAFALTIDQRLARQTATDGDFGVSQLLSVLHREENQDAYLDLLAAALGSRATAEDHVERYAPHVVESARRRDEQREGSARIRASECGLQSGPRLECQPAGSSEPVPEANAHLSPGTSSSCEVDTAQGSSGAATAAHAAAPSGRDADDPGSPPDP